MIDLLEGTCIGNKAQAPLWGTRNPDGLTNYSGLLLVLLSPPFLSLLNTTLSLLSFHLLSLWIAVMSTPQPDLPEPVHAELDSMLSRKFGKEVANYFSGAYNP